MMPPAFGAISCIVMLSGETCAGRPARRRREAEGQSDGLESGNFRNDEGDRRTVAEGVVKVFGGSYRYHRDAGDVLGCRCRRAGAKRALIRASWTSDARRTEGCGDAVEMNFEKAATLLYVPGRSMPRTLGQDGRARGSGRQLSGSALIVLALLQLVADGQGEHSGALSETARCISAQVRWTTSSTEAAGYCYEERSGDGERNSRDKAFQQPVRTDREPRVK